MNTRSQAIMTCVADKDSNQFSGDNLPTLLLTVDDIHVRNRETPNQAPFCLFISFRQSSQLNAR